LPDNAVIVTDPEAVDDHRTDALAPLLRWAGGKRWLVPEVRTILGATAVDRYHEPFLGGGSVFFALAPGEAVLSDLNAELIEVYTAVRDSPDTIADLLDRYENTADTYYEVRSAVPESVEERAARFIFLNHTSFNGIFRVNLRGEYNVPYGHRKHVRIPSRAALLDASARLRRADLQARDFGAALSDVRKGDLVFLDPPYTVAHNNNGFVKYNQHLFSFDDQKRLARAILEISERGAHFILTNAAHHSIEELFSPLGRMVKVSRRNSIGGKLASRGRADEYLFTNIEVGE